MLLFIAVFFAQDGIAAQPARRPLRPRCDGPLPEPLRVARPRTLRPRTDPPPGLTGLLLLRPRHSLRPGHVTGFIPLDPLLIRH